MFTYNINFDQLMLKMRAARATPIISLLYEKHGSAQELNHVNLMHEWASNLNAAPKASLPLRQPRQLPRSFSAISLLGKKNFVTRLILHIGTQ